MAGGWANIVLVAVLWSVMVALAEGARAQPVQSLEFRILSNRTLEQDGRRFSIFQSVGTRVSVSPGGLTERTVFRNFRTLAGEGGGRVVRQFERVFPRVAEGVYRLPNAEWRLTPTGATRVAGLDEGARRITIRFEAGGRCRARLAVAREEGRGDLRATSFIDGGPVRIISERPVDDVCRYSR